MKTPKQTLGHIITQTRQKIRSSEEAIERHKANGRDILASKCQTLKLQSKEELKNLLIIREIINDHNANIQESTRKRD